MSVGHFIVRTTYRRFTLTVSVVRFSAGIHQRERKSAPYRSSRITLKLRSTIKFNRYFGGDVRFLFPLSCFPAAFSHFQLLDTFSR